MITEFLRSTPGHLNVRNMHLLDGQAMDDACIFCLHSILQQIQALSKIKLSYYDRAVNTNGYLSWLASSVHLLFC